MSKEAVKICICKLYKIGIAWYVCLWLCVVEGQAMEDVHLIRGAASEAPSTACGERGGGTVHGMWGEGRRVTVLVRVAATNVGESARKVSGGCVAASAPEQNAPVSRWRA